MARALFAKGARGALISEVQAGLIREGLPLVRADGDFGQRTRDAVMAYQARTGTAPTGVVDTEVWRQLARRDAPSLFERCLQLTSAFEGHGYTLAAGNWDRAWLTWGIVGFTLKSGSLVDVIRTVRTDAPHCISDAFGDRAGALLTAVDGSRAEREAWATSISAPPKGLTLIEPWQSAFARFGAMPEVQAAQRASALDRYFTPAVRTAGELGLSSELGIALCFDIHVQNGSVKPAVRAELPVAPGQPERQRREAIANGVADHADPRFAENVRRRKLTIATGAGVANGVPVVLASWGLDDVPAVVT